MLRCSFCGERIVDGDDCFHSDRHLPPVVICDGCMRIAVRRMVARTNAQRAQLAEIADKGT